MGVALAEHEPELEGVEVFSTVERTDHIAEGSAVGTQCEGLSARSCYSGLS